MGGATNETVPFAIIITRRGKRSARHERREHDEAESANIFIIHFFGLFRWQKFAR